MSSKNNEENDIDLTDWRDVESEKGEQEENDEDQLSPTGDTATIRQVSFAADQENEELELIQEKKEEVYGSFPVPSIGVTDDLFPPSVLTPSHTREVGNENETEDRVLSSPSPKPITSVSSFMKWKHLKKIRSFISIGVFLLILFVLDSLTSGVVHSTVSRLLVIPVPSTPDRIHNTFPQVPDSIAANLSSDYKPPPDVTPSREELNQQNQGRDSCTSVDSNTINLISIEEATEANQYYKQEDTVPIINFELKRTTLNEIEPFSQEDLINLDIKDIEIPIQENFVEEDIQPNEHALPISEVAAPLTNQENELAVELSAQKHQQITEVVDLPQSFTPADQVHEKVEKANEQNATFPRIVASKEDAKKSTSWSSSLIMIVFVASLLLIFKNISWFKNSKENKSNSQQTAVYFNSPQINEDPYVAREGLNVSTTAVNSSQSKISPTTTSTSISDSNSASSPFNSGEYSDLIHSQINHSSLVLENPSLTEQSLNNLSNVNKTLYQPDQEIPSRSKYFLRSSNRKTTGYSFQSDDASVTSDITHTAAVRRTTMLHTRPSRSAHTKQSKK